MKFIANIFAITQVSHFHVSGIPETWKLVVLISNLLSK